jgi:glutathione S-transferase
VKLYFSPGACSLSPHIVAREAGIPIELEKVDLKAKTLADGGDYAGINSKGYVPALRLDDGSVLTEGPAIVQYLADRNPDAGLAPKAGTLKRYRLQEWLNVLTAEIHKTWGALFNPKVAGEWKQFTLETLGRRLDHVAHALEGRLYLMGARFSVADAYLFTLLNWAAWTGVELARWPVLRDHAARVGTRPRVQEALKAEA